MDKQLIERAVEAAAKALRDAWETSGVGIEYFEQSRRQARAAVTAALAEVEASLTAERDALTEGRCLADITHRDDGHRVSVCVLPKGHTTAHDDALGCIWTDADHWQPSERDDLRARIARVEALVEPCEDFVAPYSCLGSDSGKAFYAEFEADRACLPCRLRAALDVKAA